ncbi:MAG: DUF6090 family protein [Bacteroidota bacterium]
MLRSRGPKSKNESSKETLEFFKYAIREIILVVIGILIAVSINNWNEHRKNKNELRNIFIMVKEDIQNDITEINEVLTWYEKIKPTFAQVLKDSISREDYLQNQTIAYLILGYPEISFDQRGFKLLSDYNESHNDYSDTLVQNIVDFYTERMLEIQVDEKLRAGDFEDNFNHWKTGHEWWAEYIYDKKIDRFLDYALYSKDYKNRVATSHFLTYDVYLPELRKFKGLGLKIVKAIEENTPEG